MADARDIHIVINGQAEFEEMMAKILDAARGCSSGIQDEFEAIETSVAKAGESVGGLSEELASMPFEAAAPLSAAAAYYEEDIGAYGEFRAQKLNAMSEANALEEEITAAHLSREAALQRQHNQLMLANVKGTSGLMADTLQALFVASDKKHKDLFRAYKVFAVAEAVISAYLAANKALATIPPPWNIAFASMVMAQGLANAYAISQQEMTGGVGSVSGGAGGTSVWTGNPAPYAPPREGSTQPTQNVTIIINNPLTDDPAVWDKIVEDNIVPGLEGYSSRNNTLNVKVA